MIEITPIYKYADSFRHAVIIPPYTKTRTLLAEARVTSLAVYTSIYGMQEGVHNASIPSASLFVVELLAVRYSKSRRRHSGAWGLEAWSTRISPYPQLEIDFLNWFDSMTTQLASASPPQGGECCEKAVRTTFWPLSLDRRIGVFQEIRFSRSSDVYRLHESAKDWPALPARQLHRQGHVASDLVRMW